MLDFVPRIIEQNRRTDIEVGAVVPDHALEDTGM